MIEIKLTKEHLEDIVGYYKDQVANKKDVLLSVGFYDEWDKYVELDNLAFRLGISPNTPEEANESNTNTSE